MLIPGILEQTFQEVETKIRLIEDVAPEIQIDVTDGDLVEGKTFQDIQKINTLVTKSSLSIHFMVKNPCDYLRKSRTLIPFITKKINNVNTVITQVVDHTQMNKFIKIANKLGYKIGLSINHDQDLSLMEPYLSKIDLVQFMSVIPGKQGNDFIPSVLDNIKTFRNTYINTYPTIKTQIDGGVNANNLSQILETGVDNVIIGSAIFNSENPRNNILEFMKAAHGSTTNS